MNGTPVPEPAPVPGPPTLGDRGTRLVRHLLPVVSVLLLAGAFWVLHRELTLHHPREIWRAMVGLPVRSVVLAVGFTALGFMLLPTYDLLALRYLRRPLSLARIWFVGFVAFAFSSMLGAALLTSVSVRYRLYTVWGLSAVEVAQVIAFAGITFWVGVFALCGTVFAVAPADATLLLAIPPWMVRAIGLALVALPLSYLALTLLRRRPLQIRGWRIHVPAPGFAVAQTAVGVLDWTVASLVMYVLLPSGTHVPFPAFAAVFVMAFSAGVLSHVPGGLGVFESIVVLAFGSRIPTAELLGTLVLFRVVYYLMPFLVATVLLAGYEGRQRRETVSRVARIVGRWIPAATPRLLAAVTFVAGTVLLLSGVLPAVPERLRWLDALVPLPLIELSHFAGSVAGVGLLVLSWGIARRLDGAYHLSVGLLAAGMAASLLKAVDYESAVVLGAALLMLLPARDRFDRRASLLHEPLSAGWLVAIGTVLVSAFWLGWFAYRHVPYRDELWWQFALHGDAPRFLRATVGILVGATGFALARLFQAAAVRATPPTRDDLARAEAIVRRAPHTSAWLAMLGDKSLLFEPSGAAFIMYGVSRRSWVAMGDPVGEERVFPDLAWEFRELTDRYGGYTAFFQATPRHLPIYQELGLRAFKIGEDALLSLPGFSLEEGARDELRRSRDQVEGEGCRFEMLPAGAGAGLLDQLLPISDAWLADKKAREKGFSQGHFSPGYLSRFPLALVRRAGRIVAFASVWTGAERSELALDLVRYHPTAPAGVMEYLFVQVMLWGRQEGYQRFRFGMAPLSGPESRVLAPLWGRIHVLAFRHAEHFHTLQGLRHYVERFTPEWSPSYLVSPGGWPLPRVLADIATLISAAPRGVAAG